MFLSLLNILNFVFKYSNFYINYFSKVLNFQINLVVLNTWFYVFIIFIKYNSLFYKTTLIDMNTFDYNKNILLLNNKKMSLNCIIYNFYLYKYELKLNFFSFSSELKALNSISFFFNNALWLERELSEMFNINFLNKLDNRNLLLDYSYIGYPLLKSFPTIGFVELSYSFLNNWILYIKIILKESNKPEFYYY